MVSENVRILTGSEVVGSGLGVAVGLGFGACGVPPPGGLRRGPQPAFAGAVQIAREIQTRKTEIADDDITTSNSLADPVVAEHHETVRSAPVAHWASGIRPTGDAPIKYRPHADPGSGAAGMRVHIYARKEKTMRILTLVLLGTALGAYGQDSGQISENGCTKFNKCKTSTAEDKKSCPKCDKSKIPSDQALCMTCAIKDKVCSVCGLGRPGRTGSQSGRIDRYAIITCGPSGGGRLAELYFAVHQRMAKMLREVYGYPDEAVFRLHADGKQGEPGILGVSSSANLRKIFEHLAKITRKGDQVTLFLVGHGGPAGGDCSHSMQGGNLNGKQLNEMVNLLPTDQVNLILHTCFSGAFIPNVSAPNRVVITCCNARQPNGYPWIESFSKALARETGADAQDKRVRVSDKGADADGDGKISLKEAYNAVLEFDTREEPLLEDNGDRKGNNGTARDVGGDGLLAAKRYLGNEGKKLTYSAASIAELKRLNAGLQLK